MKRARLIGAVVAVVACLLLVAQAVPDKQEPVTPEQAQKLISQGNYKEAYEAFAGLALDADAHPEKVGAYLHQAIACLRSLNRVEEVDEFREKVIAVHGRNWRLLQSAAQSFLVYGDHYGSIVAGKFVRGPHRGGTARYVNSYERDRVRALQLLEQALDAIDGEPDGPAVGEFFMQLAGALLGSRGGIDAWRLQYLTDLTTLPDYEEGRYYYGGRGRGAPVDAEGNPVYHSLPASWKQAATDGQRWRWALSQAERRSSAHRQEARFSFASFLHGQFGVQTMAHQGLRFRPADADDETRKDESGTWALHTLGQDETIARLANGIKRFKLPEEHNFIRIFQQIAEDARGARSSSALRKLGEIFENRRQYPLAAEYWSKAGMNDCVQQITGNWGHFEPVLTQPAGQGASVEFRFRNGRKVSFEAFEINARKLLDDVKTYLKSNPPKLEWEKVDIGNLGYRLVEKNQQQYLGRQVAAWDLDLTPRPSHFDKRITVATPLQKPGAYLLVGKMEDGNVSRIIIWVADTAIVQKRLDKGMYYFVADAETGKPIPKANVEFFGHYQQWVQDDARSGRGHYVVHTAQFAEFTDADGQLMPDPKDLSHRYNWVAIATTAEGRFAYLGFSSVWEAGYHDAEYDQTKVFVITDRPVYRPEQPIKFKFWVNQAKYDREGPSPFAGRTFQVQVNDPRGEKAWSGSFTADEYGGFDGELTLGEEAMLGVYRIFSTDGGAGGTFRLEEYKKPEFEVKVQAPEEPVMLGEKITARIEARYYFGAPVTEGKIRYKVMRTSHTARWYPPCRWDWFYGPGYWWYAYDYTWYPGWGEWGCRRPWPWWWGWFPREQPEIVAEVEAPLDKTGLVSVEIDTSIAKALQGDTDHRYEITAEVTDLSRRTIVGQGAVLVARKPFKVHAWVDRGHYRIGDTVCAHFAARTIDGKPVQGKGELRLLKISYKDNQPVEAEAQKWALDTNPDGCAIQQIKASQAGQYRLSYRLTDAKGHAIEGGYVFCIMGEGFDGSQFRFNDLELVTDKAEYGPGDNVDLMINTNRTGGTVLLFVRAANGVCLRPEVLRLSGKSLVKRIEVLKKDMPNFFVEAVTVAGAKVHTEVREVIVPPESRVLDVNVTASAERYKPGEKAAVTLKLTDPTGEPFRGCAVVSVYDKALEYISGGSNVPEIKAFFWKWRRHHRPWSLTNLSLGGYNIVRSNETRMRYLGVFGRLVADEFADDSLGGLAGGEGGTGRGGDYNGVRLRAAKAAAAPGEPGPALSIQAQAAEGARRELAEDRPDAAAGEPGAEGAMVEPAVRTKFADTALWVAAVKTDEKGQATVELTMPENLTTWKARVWAMGSGARCGEGAVEVVTSKDLLVRLQAPRFFVQKDLVVISANVHNYLKARKTARAVLELEGGCLELMPPAGADDGLPRAPSEYAQDIDPNGEKRFDWLVRVVRPGQATIRVKALTDEESDAMEMKFPVYVHGMLKTESFTGVIRPEKDRAEIAVTVPAERMPEQTRLEVRYSPTLAMAMVDALPYMVDYPYGCTEQTLNRFLPTVITQKVLLRMGLDLKDIQTKRTNLNAQEIGDDIQRARDWQRLTKAWHRGEKNPVFDEEEVRVMVKAGLNRLTSMQCSDGGWGWFSGWGERSWPHTTALVVHGLQIARDNDVALVPGVLDRGIEWLKRYQAEEVQKIRNAPSQKHPWKPHADDLDAFVHMVLVDEDRKLDHPEMRQFLYRDRNHLAVYTKAMFGLALHRLGLPEQRDMLIRNVEQYLVQDDENQTAYLKLPQSNWWWCWHGSEYEAHAYYLKLLSAVRPKDEIGSRMVKYLLNNRRHATYWNSTRDSAAVIEAFADYLKASGEDRPEMVVEIYVDGKAAKEVRIDKDNLFSFDNKLVIVGEALSAGKHTIEFRKKGAGPLYFNAYLTNFTLEDPITRAGLEIKVNRKYYKLVRVDKTVKAEGARGEALDKKVEKYERQELANLSLVKSGDLVEIELEIDSKNDYEYIIFEDMKAAGLEPMAVRSGYDGNEMGAYVELRDERVVFFVRALARGKHSLSYRMRAEIPGQFSALPTKASAMYAPELKANSDEIKIRIQD